MLFDSSVLVLLMGADAYFYRTNPAELGKDSGSMSGCRRST